MDDLKKQKLKKVKKTVDKVCGDFSEGLNRLELDRLYERKEIIKLKINTTDNEITKQNARLQLNEIEKSIDILTGQIDIYRDIDLEIDEQEARAFIEANPDVFLDTEFDYGE